MILEFPVSYHHLAGGGHASLLVVFFFIEIVTARQLPSSHIF